MFLLLGFFVRTNLVAENLSLRFFFLKILIRQFLQPLPVRPDPLVLYRSVSETVRIFPNIYSTLKNALRAQLFKIYEQMLGMPRDP